MELKIEEIKSSAYQNFTDYIRNDKTRINYQRDLVKFLELIPGQIYTDNKITISGKAHQNMADDFVTLVSQDIVLGKSIINAYVRELKKKIENKVISPARVRNLIKPIKALFAANDIDFSWKKLDRSIPKDGKSQDKAYTREQLQLLMKKATDTVDKIIVTLCSSAGFRVESWDYFTWDDVIFFNNSDGTIKGGALCVYRGDDEEYWTHFTPEAGSYLLLYKEEWKNRFMSYPKGADPLIVSVRTLRPVRIGKGGVYARMRNLGKSCGLRPPLKPGQKRHSVMVDHGLRKYFNTMCRRAKIDFADKEELQGREASKNESHYERYEEGDFERWDEYQKVISFLTISDEERAKHLVFIKEQEKVVLNQKIIELEQRDNENQSLKERLEMIERELRIKEKYHLIE